MNMSSANMWSCHSTKYYSFDDPKTSPNRVMLFSFIFAGPSLKSVSGVEGEGRIRATRGWISVDRGSKATLPLTMPRRVFKSSAKDSARRP